MQLIRILCNWLASCDTRSVYRGGAKDLQVSPVVFNSLCGLISSIKGLDNRLYSNLHGLGNHSIVESHMKHSFSGG